MQIVILAGGLATRLRPLTENTPKALIPVGGVPFIHHQLNMLIRSGFSKFVFCVGYLGGLLVEYLDSLREWKNYFEYSVEEKPLGTGGPIINAFPLLEDDFMVLNGDNLWLGNYKKTIDYYYQIRSQPLVILRHVKRLGNVIFDANSSKIIRYARNCPSCEYEDIGVKIFNKDIFRNYPQDYPLSLEDDIYPFLIASRTLEGVLTTCQILDIGTFEALERSETNISVASNRK